MTTKHSRVQQLPLTQQEKACKEKQDDDSQPVTIERRVFAWIACVVISAGLGCCFLLMLTKVVNKTPHITNMLLFYPLMAHMLNFIHLTVVCSRNWRTPAHRSTERDLDRTWTIAITISEVWLLAVNYYTFTPTVDAWRDSYNSYRHWYYLCIAPLVAWQLAVCAGINAYFYYVFVEPNADRIPHPTNPKETVCKWNRTYCTIQACFGSAIATLLLGTVAAIIDYFWIHALTDETVIRCGVEGVMHRDPLTCNQHNPMYEPYEPEWNKAHNQTYYISAEPYNDTTYDTLWTLTFATFMFIHTALFCSAVHGITKMCGLYEKLTQRPFWNVVWDSVWLVVIFSWLSVYLPTNWVYIFCKYVVAEQWRQNKTTGVVLACCAFLMCVVVVGVQWCVLSCIYFSGKDDYALYTEKYKKLKEEDKESVSV